MLFFDFFQRKTSRKFGVSNKNNYLCSRKSSGFSAVGSAHVWGARGRWFESSNPDINKRVENQYGFRLFFIMSNRLMDTIQIPTPTCE